MSVLVPESRRQEELFERLRGCLGPQSVSYERADNGQAAVAGVSLQEELDTEGPLDYEAGEKLAMCLSLQLDLLEAAGIAPLSLEPEDIVVTPAGLFLYTGVHRCLPLDKNGDISVQIPPLSRVNAVPGTLGGEHLAPEIRGQISIPCTVARQSPLFSLALLVASSMGLKGSIAPIEGTGL